MSKRRKLTVTEKNQIRSYILAKEYGRNPTACVEISIADELDEEGRFHVRSTAVSEIKVREGDEPWKRR